MRGEETGRAVTANTRVQVWGLFAILLANFVAQVPYFYHLYYSPAHPLPDPRSALLMGAVFALFIGSFALLMLGQRAGYYLMLFYLALEFFFYLFNVIGGALHGYGLFFHLADRDPVLWAVYNWGYVSFFAAGYFLYLLLTRRMELRSQPSQTRPA